MTLGLMLSFVGRGVCVCVCLTASADSVVKSKVFLAGMAVSLTESSEGSHCALRCNPRGNPSLLFPNQKEILLSPLGRLPTEYLDVCRPAAAFVPLGIYGLLFLLLTSHPVATTPCLASTGLCSWL